MQVRITADELRAQANLAVSLGEPIRLHDTDLRGFGCYISPNGQVSFFAQKHIGGRGGKQIRTVIGHLVSMSIVEARKQALIDLGKMASGEDISLRRKALLAAQRKLLETKTLKETVELYMTQLDVTEKYKKSVGRYFENVIIPAIGHKTLITHVSKEHIKAIRRNPSIKSQSNIDTQCLRPFFRWAVQEDYLPTNPMDNLPSLPGPNEVDRVLSDSEIAIVWNAAAQLGYPWRQYIQLLLLTGQRRLETAQMAWIELNNSTWTIPAEKTKTNQANVVHLSPLSLSILGSIQQRVNCDYVFSTRKGVPISGFGDGKEYIDKAIAQITNVSIDKWTFHALRRTVATGMQQLGIEPWVIEKILNHAEASKVARIYRRFEYLEERRAALDKWAQHIAQLTAQS